jgi:hypothetical protein
MNVKLSYVPAQTLIYNIFPSAEDLMFSSKSFDDFELAVESSNRIANQLKNVLNEAVSSDRYRIMSEVNPSRSSSEDLKSTSNWLENEIAKIWVIDDMAEINPSGAIHAIALSQLLEIPVVNVTLN